MLRNFALALLLSVWAAALPAHAQPKSAPRCLGAEVGQRIGEAMPRARAELAPGWQLLSANIEFATVILAVQAPDGPVSKGRLLEAPRAPEQARRWRWFALEPAPQLDDATRAALETAAEALDAAFASDPFAPCRSLPSVTPPLPEVKQRPWLLLLLLGVLLLGPGRALLTLARQELRGPAPVLMLTGLVLWATSQWWPALGGPYINDEMANLATLGPDALWRFPDTHPPLYRWVLTSWGAGAEAIHAARALSLGCSLLSIGLLFLLARRLCGSWLIAALAALLYLAHEEAGIHATLYRSYALWGCVMLWHVGALLRWVDEGTGGRRLAALDIAGSALLLAQLHYFSAPLLLIEGIALLAFFGRRRWGALLLVPAGVSVLPLALRTMAQATDLEPGRGSVGSALGYVLSSELGLPALCLVAAGVVLWRWRELSLAQRLPLVVTVASLGSAVPAGWLHFLRPAAGLFALPGIALMAAVAASGEHRRIPLLRIVLGIALIAFLHTNDERSSYRAAHPNSDAAMRDFALERLGSVPSDSPWMLYPAARLPQLSMFLRRNPGHDMWSDEARCDGLMCFEHQGQRYLGVDTLAAGTTPPGWVLVLDPRDLSELEDCRQVQGDSASARFDCRGRSAQSPPAAESR